MERFTTNDVYIIMDTALMREDYHLLDLEAKKTKVTECFTNYFIYKLIQLSGKSGKNVEKLSLLELFAVIEEKVLNDETKEKLSYPVSYLLSIISCIQGFEILWEINDELEKPEISINRDLKFDKLLTSSKHSMSLIFEMVYQYFMKNLTVGSFTASYSLSKEN